MSNRPETGPMRFGKDWCGVFIRGDAALLYRNLAQCIMVRLQNDKPINRHLKKLMALMDSCNQGRSCDGTCEGEQDAGEILRKMEEGK